MASRKKTPSATEAAPTPVNTDEKQAAPVGTVAASVTQEAPASATATENRTTVSCKLTFRGQINTEIDVIYGTKMSDAIAQAAKQSGVDPATLQVYDANGKKVSEDAIVPAAPAATVETAAKAKRG